jgi:hypothetical protein
MAKDLGARNTSATALASAARDSRSPAGRGSHETSSRAGNHANGGGFDRASDRLGHVTRPSLWAGMNLGGWLRLLARNRFDVDLACLPAALAITPCTMLNSALGLCQQAVFGRRVERTELRDDPLFIIGHWRTGTTLLHELLALDARHTCPTTYQCLVPNHFLLTEQIATRWLAALLPRNRPMDNMRVSWGRPQEDEAALCNLGLPSTFLTVAFPNRPLQSPEYIDLERLSEPQLRQWQATLVRFLKQVTYRRPGRIVLKSPQHTFRLRVLNRMFPRARFIYLVRNPYVVFSSTVHFWTSMYRQYGLQRPQLDQLHEQVFDTFAAMHRQVQTTRGLIAPDRFIELRYEDLIADPLPQLRNVYERLSLGDFDAVSPAIEQYFHRTRKYETNRYELTPELRQEIGARWADYLQQYRYD